MKKNVTFLIATLLFVVFSNTLLMSQQENSAATIPKSKDKKLVITIRSIGSDGAKNTTTMTLTGDEAQTFDVKKYIAEQIKDNPNAEVPVDDNPSVKSTNRNYGRNFNQNFNQNDHQSYNYSYSGGNKDQGFLGVSEYSSAEKVVEGVRVHITRNSGAAKAGLKDEDVILQLNKTPINSYRDISAFMRKTKSGDKVEVVYDRDGATKTVTATLGQQQDAWSMAYVEQTKEACLGVYTSSQSENGQRGAVINDFMEQSAAKESKMQLGDVITLVDGIRVKSHQDVWDEIAKHKPKDVVVVTYQRGDARQQIRATLKACKPKTGDENVIIVPKTTENQSIAVPANLGRLELENFSASPNPTKNMVNVNFRGQAVPTNLAFYDVTGKVLLQQNLSDFNGEYSQRFDLSEYAKGIVVVKVQQGDKVFSSQIVVN